jgi:hypothetical protein
MNQTNINMSSARVFLSYEQWLELLASTLLIEIFSVCVVPFLGIVGIVLNIIALWCLLDDKFKKVKLYKYLKVYMVNSLLICLFCIGFISQSRRFSEIAQQHWALFYSAYIHLPIIFVLYSFAGLIDIMIIIDRISIMSSKSPLFFKRIRPYAVCFVLFLIAFGLNATVWINYVPTMLTVQLGESYWHTFRILNPTLFNYSYAGQLIMNLQMAFRDIFVCLSHFVLNGASLLMLKKHLNKKSKILIGAKGISVDNRTRALDGSNKANEPTLNHNSSSIETNFNESIRKASKSTRKEAASTSNNRKEMLNEKEETTITKSPSSTNKKSKLSRADLNATLMVTILTFISMIEHLVFFLAMLNRWSPISATFFIIANLFIAIKHSSNFVVLFIFNSIFRQVFLEKLNLK